MSHTTLNYFCPIQWMASNSKLKKKKEKHILTLFSTFLLLHLAFIIYVQVWKKEHRKKKYQFSHLLDPFVTSKWDHETLRTYIPGNLFCLFLYTIGLFMHNNLYINVLYFVFILLVASYCDIPIRYLWYFFNCFEL